jgi:hypothetical protein
MRWVMMVTYLLALLGSLAASAVIAYETKNAIPFIVPTALLAAMRPIVRYLFGPAPGREPSEQ